MSIEFYFVLVLEIISLSKAYHFTSDVLLEDSEKEDIAFLVVGDPFGYVHVQCEIEHYENMPMQNTGVFQL